jgi:hypothetical protein
VIKSSKLDSGSLLDADLLPVAGDYVAGRGKCMLQKITKIIKWVSLPALLISSMCSRSAGSYELLLDFAICLGAIVFVQGAVRSREYFWAVGFVTVAVVFSPLLLLFKIFLLMGLTCLGMFIALLAAFRTQPLAAV